MKITVEEIKNTVIENANEEEAFYDIINLEDNMEITRDDLEEMLDADIRKLAEDHIDIYNEDLLEWYSQDISKLYKYANKSNLFSSGDVVKILQDGQRVYWEKRIEKMRNKLFDFLDNWDEEDL